MAKIKIEWLYDSWDCEACGVTEAMGALVTVDDEIKLRLTPHAACYEGEDYTSEDVYRAILVALGHEVEDPRA